MSRNFVLPFAGALVMGAMAVTSAMTGQMAFGASSLEMSSQLTVDGWNLATDDHGKTAVQAVTVSGIPQSVVGKQITVYLHADTTTTTTAQITNAGSIEVPVSAHLHADELKDVSLVVAG